MPRPRSSSRIQRGDVVEEVAVVGDDEDRALVVDQVLLQPGDGLGVEVVGRLVEQQHVGRLEQQLAERDAALLAARERVDARRRRAGSAAPPSRRRPGCRGPRGCAASIWSWRVVISSISLVGVVLGDLHRDFVVAVEEGALGGDALHDVAAHVERGVELGLLRQVADARRLRRPRPRPGSPCRGRP